MTLPTPPNRRSMQRKSSHNSRFSETLDYPHDILTATLWERLKSKFETARRRYWWFDIPFIIAGVLIVSMGLYQAITGETIIDLYIRIKDALAEKELVETNNVMPVIYDIIERHVEFEFDCPENLDDVEWQNFKSRLQKLDFRELSAPANGDLAEYRRKFVDVLDRPPTTEFDCGFMRSELAFALRPVLADYEINVQKARSDGQYTGLVRGLGGYLDIMRLEYLLLLGFEPERLENARTEASMFVEYLAIWMVMFFDEERTSTVEKAQGALLYMDPTNVRGSINYNKFVELQDDLLRLSHALSVGDKEDIGLYAGRSTVTISDLASSVISEQEATYLGGDKLNSIVKALREYELSKNSTFLVSLRQLIDALRKARPENS